MSFGTKRCYGRDKMDMEKNCFDNNAFVLSEQNLWMPDLVRMNFDFILFNNRFFIHECMHLYSNKTIVQ